MLSALLADHARLLVPALLGWVAWASWRAPCQGRASRLLTAFLVLVAVGFGLEFAWLEGGSVPALGWAARVGELLVGFADPPVLLAFCLTFPRPARRWKGWRLAAPYASAALVLLVALALGHDRNADYTDPAWRWAAFLYVTGTYLAAFAVVAHRLLTERRRLLRGQLFPVALGTGFITFARVAAAVVPGGGPLHIPGNVPPLAQALDGALAALAAAGLAWLCLAVARPALARRALPLLASLAGLLVAFFLVWGTVLAVVPAFGLLFALRWVFFAVLVGYGMLRYQLFDLQAEGWRMLAYAVAVTAGIVVAAATVEATGGRRALDPVALAAGLAAALAIYLGLARLARPRPFAGPRELLLDIYENTLGHAVDPRHLTPGERRMVETLRDLFDVLPEEQERILERLARDPPLSAR